MVQKSVQSYLKKFVSIGGGTTIQAVNSITVSV